MKYFINQWAECEFAKLIEKSIKKNHPTWVKDFYEESFYLLTNYPDWSAFQIAEKAASNMAVMLGHRREELFAIIDPLKERAAKCRLYGKVYRPMKGRGHMPKYHELFMETLRK